MSISTEGENTRADLSSSKKKKRKHDQIDTDFVKDHSPPVDKKRKKHRRDAETDATDIPPSQTKEKKGKKKSRLDDDGENGDEKGGVKAQPEVEGSGETKRRKKKLDSNAELILTYFDDPPEDGDTHETGTGDVETQKEKKHRKKPAEVEGREGVSTEVKGTGKTKKSKKSKTVEEDIHTVPEGASVVEDEKEEKRKKKKSRSADVNIDSTESTPKEKPKAEDCARESKEAAKDRKKRTKGLSDPEGDESLSEQASKALSYAYSQFGDPASWKFQKARQNWLIRNLWSETSIPETYIPLVTRYLSKTQGGVRENVIKTCRAHLSPPTVASDTAVEGAQGAEPPTAPSPPAPSDTIRARAKIVLDALAGDERPT